jgi:hypothetical protein
VGFPARASVIPVEVRQGSCGRWGTTTTTTGPAVVFVLVHLGGTTSWSSCSGTKVLDGGRPAASAGACALPVVLVRVLVLDSRRARAGAGAGAGAGDW